MRRAGFDTVDLVAVARVTSRSRMRRADSTKSCDRSREAGVACDPFPSPCATSRQRRCVAVDRGWPLLIGAHRTVPRAPNRGCDAAAARSRAISRRKVARVASRARCFGRDSGARRPCLASEAIVATARIDRRRAVRRMSGCRARPPGRRRARVGGGSYPACHRRRSCTTTTAVRTCIGLPAKARSIGPPC